jgi:hypothetical protein
LRAYLGELFPEAWANRIARIAAMRSDLRAKGVPMGEVAAATDRLIDEEGWLPRR